MTVTDAEVGVGKLKKAESCLIITISFSKLQLASLASARSYRLLCDLNKLCAARTVENRLDAPQPGLEDRICRHGN